MIIGISDYQGNKAVAYDSIKGYTTVRLVKIPELFDPTNVYHQAQRTICFSCLEKVRLTRRTKPFWDKRSKRKVVDAHYECTGCKESFVIREDRSVH